MHPLYDRSTAAQTGTVCTVTSRDIRLSVCLVCGAKRHADSPGDISRLLSLLYKKDREIIYAVPRTSGTVAGKGERLDDTDIDVTPGVLLYYIVLCTVQEKCFS